MNQKNLFKRSALAAAVAIVSSNVYAAGFQLNEYTAAGLGRSFSGEGACNGQLKPDTDLGTLL